MTDKAGSLKGLTIVVKTVYVNMPAIDPDRPGNGYYGDHYTGGCWSRSPSGSWHCYAKKGHAGDHLGHTSSREGSTDHRRSWPNDDDMTPMVMANRPDNSYQATASKQCRATHGGMYCLATRGHSGDHMPYYNMGRAHSQPWPNTTGPAPAISTGSWMAYYTRAGNIMAATVLCDTCHGKSYERSRAATEARKASWARYDRGDMRPLPAVTSARCAACRQER